MHTEESLMQLAIDAGAESPLEPLRLAIREVLADLKESQDHAQETGELWALLRERAERAEAECERLRRADDSMWKSAVIDELVVAHIYDAKHDEYPRLAVKAAINWNVAIALDPQVSSEAQALIDRGKNEAMKAILGAAMKEQP